MLEKSFGLFYYLKQTKTQKKHKKYIYLRITVDGERKDISLKRQWDTLNWNTEFGRATGNKKDARELNSYLDVITSKVYQIKRHLMEMSKPITAQNIKDLLTGKEDQEHTIIAEIEKHNERIASLIGTDFERSTLTRYKTVQGHAQAFINWKYQQHDLNIKQLNYEFISDFGFWLKSERNCGHNAAMKYLSNFKKIVLECVKKGWLKSDPFVDYKFNRKEAEPVALTQAELNRIVSKKFVIDRLEHVKDIFLFSCFTGLSYVDVYKLHRDDIIAGEGLEKWINTKRKKTKAITRLPLLPAAEQIMNKYNQHPTCIKRCSVLPVLTNQKMNSYLKEIADQCKINKNLTFHIARHTFATTVTLENGVPMETVSKMLGHKSLKHTQHYAKLTDNKVGSDMRLLKRKLKANAELLAT
ncbi:site-specific integrase [Mucilaginibacter flavus]|uniref:site-specific integrase n=1 Tax=Mucilaginibacter flavus TaxID=931504 RepID=UPI0025B4268D|nr:site-specific integrase [Mucilaginibacter flavus]MDN3583470.1 site-specific integrase [Mucilaginibacter flavus]